tara:strand:- start:2316 stop:2678 length:363 start_codon:yes stop_codon:yes gene_type:complete
MKMNRMRLLAVSFFMILQVGCNPMTSYPDEISNYERFGSNSWNIWNIPQEYLTTDDSQCVTKVSSVSVDNQVSEQITRNCIEVTKLGNETPVADMFFKLLDSFFNSPSGMMLFSELLELL